MAEYKHSKSVSETYHITWPGEFTWANIMINEMGDLNIQSDYGNYTYGWRSFGDNFKKFLIRICGKSGDHPKGYLYDKLHDHSKAATVDVKKSLTVWKKEIIRMRRETGLRYKRYDWVKLSSGEISQEQAKDVWDSICIIERELGSTCSQDRFYMSLDRESINDVFDWEWRIHGDGSPETTGDVACEAFCREIAPVFAKILQDELDQEAMKESA
ncbi:hypothetical protein GZH47_33300 (plasmid) [Paenibacillus rhizovicinus]|uniref:Uncharacterized protein n=1 Tax=Paenibacillus rhizovicinus TaxID=2704463 RepID=A0A6C0PCZ0_9BACL|nr:hypothetical protein [Paenibacillus rhizovicinus]QHW35772.1 hypothetical protein GZH47_33300 [Paenibacillus rhizovicinus]